MVWGLWFMDSLTVSLFRLRVIADADPGAVARVMERFQNINVLPRRVIAEFGINETIHIQVDVCGIAEEQLKTVAVKIAQATSIVSAYWHRL
jgi:hypothetical protein